MKSAVLVLSCLLAACGAGITPSLRSGKATPGVQASHTRDARGKLVETSNVTRADYAGSASCQPCHSEIHERWQHAPMRRMTRGASGAEIKAPFDGRVFRMKDDTVTLTEDKGERFMQIVSRFGDEIYRVTRVIGGHHREDFAGIRVIAATAGAVGQGPEKILPVSHVLATGELRYKGYSVMLPERPGVKAGPVWNRTCIFCHNTASWLTTSVGWVGGPAAAKYQGAVLDTALPAGKQLWPTVVDPAGLRAALSGELVGLGHGQDGRDGQDGRNGGDAGDAGHAHLDSSAPVAIKQSIGVVRKSFEGTNLLEVGIGCEACHNGSKEHVQDPTVHPSFAPVAPFLDTGIKPGTAMAQTRACARCHQVLFTGYTSTWEGGDRKKNPGGSNINSGEARDMLLGGCATEMTCSHCHDLHAADGGAAKLAALETPAGNATCTSCHAKYGTDAQVAAHTHHEPKGAGAMCVSCHMPRKNMSLDNALGRYHRIASPTEAAKVEGDRPLECALCHQDKSVRTLVSTMESWWGKHYDSQALTALYGSLDSLPLQATLVKGKSHEQAVAMYLLGESRSVGSAPGIAAHLLHPRPIVRFYARGALEKILGEHAPVDIHADGATVASEGTAWLRRHGISVTLTPGATGPSTSEPEGDGVDAR